MYQHKLLILVFLIAGYSGYVAADEKKASVPAKETHSSTAQPEKSPTTATNPTTSPVEPDKKPTESQSKKPTESQSKKPTEPQNKKAVKQNKQMTDAAKNNQEDQQNKKECVFKAVMSDEDYYVCGIKPYTKSVSLRYAPME
jgi:hypothetical protein